MQGISQQCHPAQQAEVPELHRNHAASHTFAAKPLHEESGREQQLAAQSDRQPHCV